LIEGCAIGSSIESADCATVVANGEIGHAPLFSTMISPLTMALSTPSAAPFPARSRYFDVQSSPQVDIRVF
jgi:hypothetical protein